jgi:hypothetical protein
LEKANKSSCRIWSYTSEAWIATRNDRFFYKNSGFSRNTLNLAYEIKEDFMKIFRIAAILIPLLCATTFIFADHFKSDEDAYAYGYRAGFNQGIADDSARLEFNCRRESYRTGGVNFQTYDDRNFQRGYEDGYTDGFYRGKQTRVVVNNSHDSQGFPAGYRVGYRQGVLDREAGLDLNYGREVRFEAGVSYDSTPYFRTGYQQGYKQGYYGASIDDSRYAYYSSTSVLPPTRGFVTVFTDDDFQGKMQEFPVGRYSDLHGDLDDSIDSIRISGPVRVILFEDDDFEGDQLVIERDIKDLDNFNFDDKAGSMIVEPLY